MNKFEAIEQRHSVRAYRDEPIPPNIIEALEEAIREANAESGLRIQLVTDEPETFNNLLAKYGQFRNVKNYLACVGRDRPGLEELVGYYGQRIVILAQQLGLNSCWTGLTYSKRKCAAQVQKGERLVIAVSLGYGETQGKPRKTKPVEDLCAIDPGVAEVPEWFAAGMLAAQLAPTAVNQQKFTVELHPCNEVGLRADKAPYAKVDKGIVKYNFEVGANFISRDWSWVD